MMNIFKQKPNTSAVKVFVGLSGGVDSAVSAALLQKEGYEVTGVFIRIVVPGYPCTAGADRIDAMRVAAHLRIPFLEVDFSKEYEREVFKPSIQEFAKGETPNPDTLCNREIKFGKFFEFCRSRGADYIATGHYVRLRGSSPSGVHDFPAEKSLSPRAVALRSHLQNSSASPVKLLAGTDSDKDQSYFLWSVPETALRYTLFPVGHMRKTEVRVLAKKFDLPNAERPDSQGLCFLGPISIDEMLVRELTFKRGNVISEDGKILGTHGGAARYTLGQRHGFTLATEAPDVPPYFVVAKDIKKNTVTVSTSRLPRSAKKTQIKLRGTNWIGEVSSGPCEARFRYRQKLIPAELQGSVATLFEPHFVPLGQSLVLYRGEHCLGGGVIASATLK